MDIVLTNKEMSVLHMPELVKGILVNETRAIKASYILAELERKGLVEKKWRGKRYAYKLAPKGILALVDIRFELYDSLEGEEKFNLFYVKQTEEGEIIFFEEEILNEEITEELKKFELSSEMSDAEKFLNSNFEDQGVFCITDEIEMPTGADFCIIILAE